MSMIERAARFSPFQALTGYGAAVEEAGRLTEEKIELADNQKEALDERLQLLRESIAEHPSMTVTYFKPDLLKYGGSYETASGPIKRIDQIERVLAMENGTIIPINDILRRLLSRGISKNMQKRGRTHLRSTSLIPAKD